MAAVTCFVDLRRLWPHQVATRSNCKKRECRLSIDERQKIAYRMAN
jgi:hypothetical protein